MTPLTESQALAILESDTRLRLALAAGRMGIWEWDAKTNLIVWDGTEQRIPGAGHSRAVTPEQFFNVVHPDDRAHVERAFTAALHSQQSFEAEFRIVRSTGEVRWLVGRAMALRDNEGGTAKLVGVNFDITDRKRTEQARSYAETLLREAHGLIKTITDNATTAIFMMDADGMTTFMNPAAEAMIGVTFSEMEGRVLHDLVHHAHATGEPYGMEDCCIGRSILTLREVREHEDEFMDSAGRVFPVRCNASPIFKDGELAGVVLEVRDITDERRVQQAIREADRRKDHFLATLAHELRNPLAPICNVLHVLRMGTPDPAKLPWALGLMDRQVAQLVRLIEDLLDISRITLGKLTLRLRRESLHEIIDCAVETSRPLMDERRHRFHIDLPDAPIAVQADAARLAQVLANVLNNAAKYSDPGASIDLSARAVRGQAIIAVRDTGRGIPAEQLTRIFDMYTQGHEETAEAVPGLGIGLALVRRLVELHGGTVEAHSDGPGKGSEFIVRIPLAESTAQSIAPPDTRRSG